MLKTPYECLRIMKSLTPRVVVKLSNKRTSTFHELAQIAIFAAPEIHKHSQTSDRPNETLLVYGNAVTQHVEQHI